MDENEFRVIIFRKTIIKKLINARIQKGLNNHYFLSLFEKEEKIKEIFNYYKNNLIEKYEPNRIFNYYEYYFTYLEGKQIEYHLHKIEENKLNNIEKLLYSYYEYIISLYQSNNSLKNLKKKKEKFSKTLEEFNSENEIKKINEKQKNIGNEQDKKIYEDEKQIIKKITYYLKLLSDLYAFKYQKKFFFVEITDIIDQKVKECDISKEDLIYFKENLINLYNKKDCDGKCGIILRLFYLEKNYLIDLIKDKKNEVSELIREKEAEKYKEYFTIYDYPIEKIETIDKDENKNKNKNKVFEKIYKIEKKLDFVKTIKGRYLNYLINNNIFSKELIKLSIYIFQNICYPLSDALFYLTIIYNGLICDKFENENLKLKDTLIVDSLNINNYSTSKLNENIRQLNENDDLKFKKLIFEYLYNYLYNNYDIYRIQKLRKVPQFHLLILKIFIWKLNVENGNNFEILKTYYKLKVLLIKLKIPIENETIFENVLLIYEIIGDTYLNLKYYRKAKKIYKSMKRYLKEYKNNQYKNDSIFKVIENKIKICKYFSGYNLII